MRGHVKRGALRDDRRLGWVVHDQPRALHIIASTGIAHARDTVQVVFIAASVLRSTKARPLEKFVNELPHDKPKPSGAHQNKAK